MSNNPFLKNISSLGYIFIIILDIRGIPSLRFIFLDFNLRMAVRLMDHRQSLSWTPYALVRVKTINSPFRFLHAHQHTHIHNPNITYQFSNSFSINQINLLCFNGINHSKSAAMMPSADLIEQ